jgi:hypothetical protein
MPEAWADLIAAIQLLSKHSTGSFPFHCEHDTLTVMANPEQFTNEELGQLYEWGFFPSSEYEGTFTSFRYGSA